jgi:hypothetical protein
MNPDTKPNAGVPRFDPGEFQKSIRDRQVRTYFNFDFRVLCILDWFIFRKRITYTVLFQLTVVKSARENIIGPVIAIDEPSPKALTERR